MNEAFVGSDSPATLFPNEAIAMKKAICFGEIFDDWLVSRCGKVYCLRLNKYISYIDRGQLQKNGKRTGVRMKLIMITNLDFWKDGSGFVVRNGKKLQRNIFMHKVIMDTWKPLYDNPPDDISWEEWKIARDMPTVYDHIRKTIIIDHIDDNGLNNHVDNLRRTNHWRNQKTRKERGI